MITAAAASAVASWTLFAAAEVTMASTADDGGVLLHQLEHVQSIAVGGTVWDPRVEASVLCVVAHPSHVCLHRRLCVCLGRVSAGSSAPVHQIDAICKQCVLCRVDLSGLAVVSHSTAPPPDADCWNRFRCATLLCLSGLVVN